MSFRIEYKDITGYEVDAIVMPANPKPKIGYGVDKLIYHRAGRNRLFNDRKRIGQLSFGDAALSSAYDMKARFIVHAVSPTWVDGNHDEEKLLEACYENSLKITYQKGCRSIVFPLLSSGIQHFPRDKAKDIAVKTCTQFAQNHPDMEIILTLYNKGSKQLQKELAQYLEENSYAYLDEEEYKKAEKNWGNLPEHREEKELFEIMRKKIRLKRADEQSCAEFEERLNSELNSNLEKGNNIKRFSDVFDDFKLTKKAGSDSDICKRARVNKATLSHYKKEDRPVQRDILWAFAIALKLNTKETEMLFNSCGICTTGKYRLQDAEIKREDIICEFIEKKVYDMDKINTYLYENNLLPLGNETYTC